MDFHHKKIKVDNFVMFFSTNLRGPKKVNRNADRYAWDISDTTQITLARPKIAHFWRFKNDQALRLNEKHAICLSHFETEIGVFSYLKSCGLPGSGRVA